MVLVVNFPSRGSRVVGFLPSFSSPNPHLTCLPSASWRIFISFFFFFLLRTFPLRLSWCFCMRVCVAGRRDAQPTREKGLCGLCMQACRQFLRHRIKRGGHTAWVCEVSLAEMSKQGEGIFSEGDTTALRPPFSSAPVARRLTTTEEAVRRISLFYSPHTYAYGLLSALVLFDEAKRRGLLDPKVDAGKFFVHPMALVRHPEMFSQFFGPERSQFFSAMLQQLLAVHDAEYSSVVRVCRSQGVDATRWIPFLRGLCLCVIAGDPILSEASFVIEDLILNGVLHDGLSVPGDYNDRGVSVADMLMEAAVELGSARLSELSLSVYRQFLPETPYAVSKRLALCITRGERRHLDWNLRCLPRKPRGRSRLKR
ncbi:hypothetical protein, conserved [Trypanosoma cruzi]|uniref:Uncharacterized protein n=2 Tax=Trypanosoma cruzi TaxID=5693 RepID=Q4DQB2_TRYCC|nr:hypothetical protein, conserved [Trypanosoma cruzi]EAN94716.1 hypothetical protein, conserved [Trypanosoma cruzi]|eukprot:XP_816567.1 hypothetical protein [Trypanosoma cruzi strain CL Brener]